jgi:hypothetical protein
LLCSALQGDDFLDSYIGFVAAGYSLKVRLRVRCLCAQHLLSTVPHSR